MGITGGICQCSANEESARSFLLELELGGGQCDCIEDEAWPARNYGSAGMLCFGSGRPINMDHQ
jgi:hypothetical protein